MSSYLKGNWAIAETLPRVPFFSVEKECQEHHFFFLTVSEFWNARL